MTAPATENQERRSQERRGFRPLRTEDVLELHRSADAPCVSLYMPTHRAGQETQQDPIRLKNLLAEAERQLERRGFDEPDRLLAPARRLLDDYEFWQHQSDGLGAFLAPGAARFYRLPLSFEELVVVDERFHLKPLLPLITEGGRFYVLALSQKHVRLFVASHHRISEVDVGGVLPQSLADALGYDWEQRSLQFHSQARGAGGRKEAIFHGHGAGDDDHEPELRRFLEILDRGLSEGLSEKGIPMVVAGVEEVVSLFHQVSGYPQLLDDSVVGNQDAAAADDLRDRAWKLVAPVFASVREEALGQFASLRGSGRTSEELEEIVKAAFDGRVDSAFVAVDRQIWGRYDAEERAVQRDDEATEENGDLLDLVALQSLSTGAQVFALPAEEVPGDGAVAAVLRY